MALRTNTAEGGTDGTLINETNVSTITAGASGNPLGLERTGGTASFSATQKHRGSLAYKLAYAASQNQSLRWGSWAGTKLASTRAYHYFPTLVAGQSHELMSIWSSSYSGALILTIDGTGRALLQASWGTVYHPAASTFTFTTGQWYRVEMAMSIGASPNTGTAKLAVYVGDATTPAISFTSTTANTGPTADSIASVLVGRSNSPAYAYDHYIDNLAAQDGTTAEIGPAPADTTEAPPIPAETPGTLRANTAEGGALGATITTSDQTGGGSGTALKYWATGGSVSFGSTRQKGALGYQFAYASGAKTTLYWDGWGTTTYSVSTRSYHLFPGVPTGYAQALLTIFNDAYRDVAVLVLNTEGKLAVHNAAGAVIYTTPDALLPNVWYRFEFAARLGTSTSNGRVRLSVFGGDSTTATHVFSTDTADTGLSSTNHIGSVYFGRNNSDLVDMVHHMDDLAAQGGTTTLLGPSGSGSAPTANAGTDLTGVEPYRVLQLTGTDADPDGSVASRTWRQVSGTPTVTLTGASTVSATYTAPGTLAGTTLVFGYQVTDASGLVSTEDTVSHTILPVLERAVLNGAEVPVNIQAVMNGGLR